ncbi:hypothetical protein ACF3NA_01595 [Alkanindiges sp. WGS2144]|uniref:hypothetical protein n=1 Tax=Alkanindiges sp. WGS2144 TaxID=3366808 RepID=UPI0037524989
MAKNLYPYTLQPVPFELSEAEQRTAQLAIWRKTNTISKKTWIVLGIIVAIAIIGLALVKNYSTLVFWLMLVGVGLYLLIRRFGLEWYVKRKLDQELIDDIKGIKMGVQPQGLVMIQRMGMQEARGVISWKDINEWQDHPNFLFLNFRVKGQQGAHILPKRMDSQNFSFNTIRKHLNEVVGPAK